MTGRETGKYMRKGGARETIKGGKKERREQEAGRGARERE
jgi:hypothetical protein